MPNIAALYNYPLYTGDTTGFHIIANDNAETITYKVHKEDLLSGLAITGSNTFKGTQTFSGSLIPVGSGSYDLGSASNPFRHLYLSSASLYIDGQKVLGSTNQELQITTDAGQSIKILETGTDTITLQSVDGDIQMKSSGGGNVLLDPTTGVIDLRGTVQVQDGNKITSSGGNSVVFGNNVIITGSILSTGTALISGSAQLSSLGYSTTGSNIFVGNQTVNGNLQVVGNLIAQQYIVSSSVTYLTESFSSGSNNFGDSLDDYHNVTGSLNITGSLKINGTSYTAATSGTSGTSGVDGASGTSGSNGRNGSSGTSGSNGTNGSSGTSGSNGTNGSSGTSGSSGSNGTNGSSGTSGSNGTNGSSGSSGSNGTNGTSGSSGSNGTNGSSGTSITTSGTNNTLTKFTSTTTVGNATNLTDDGTTFRIAENTIITGSLTVTGNLTAQQYIISSSVTYLTESFASGSHRFGDSLDDTHQFTGSLLLTGSANINGNTLITGSITSTGNIIGGATLQNTYHYLNSYTGSGTQLIGVVGSNSSANGGYLKVINDSAAGGVRGVRLGLNGNGTQPGNGTDVLTISDSAFMGVGTTSPADIIDVQRNQNGTTNFYFRNTDTTNTNSRAYLNVVAGSTSISLLALNGGDTYIAGTTGKDMYFQQSPGGTVNAVMTSAGTFRPGANGTQDLGTSAYRWGTVYTSDLSLNNGIGDWTIVEGEDDLFLYNNKKGKVYKFALTEVDPNVATPKKS